MQYLASLSAAKPIILVIDDAPDNLSLIAGLFKEFYTVNTASRMESTAAPGTIQISAMTHEQLQDNYIFSKNGLIQCKGLGEIEAYALVGKR